MDTIKVDMENLSNEEREQLLKLIEKSNQPKSKVWIPKFSDKYFALSDYGAVDEREWTTGAHTIDTGRYAIGNCFKTEEEAQFALEKLKVITELKRFAEENNEREIVWDDESSNKILFYNHFLDRVDVEEDYSNQHSFIYFSSYKIAMKAIDAIGEDRLKKYYFEVEE